MSNRNDDDLSERERACLAHLEEANKLGLSFSRYCREKNLSMHQWTWIKRALMRKGLVGGRRRAERPKSTGFVAVRVAPPSTVAVAAATVCLLRHSSGWTIECASLPDVRWLSALMSGEAR